jgi:hypothetical protein
MAIVRLRLHSDGKQLCRVYRHEVVVVVKKDFERPLLWK